MKLHVSAHESHHQAYKYCIIKKKNVQLLAGLYKKKTGLSSGHPNIQRSDVLCTDVARTIIHQTISHSSENNQHIFWGENTK